MIEAEPAHASRGSIDRLIAKINETRGIDLSQYRIAYVERRLAARMRTLNVRTYRQYADLLESDPDEYAKLLDTLTINVTDFFRDGIMWESLRANVLPSLIESKRAGRNRTIRLWSAGCATGEEAYSLAMMMLDHLGAEASRYLISVLATDLDPIALKKAEAGVYHVDRLKRIPPGYQVRFTRSVNDTQFEIRPEVKRMVRFRRMSLFDPSPVRIIDLILCRNVFIYFDREQQARVLDNFWDSLSRGGYLVLGRSEKLSPDMSVRLESVDGKERIYRKPARM